MIQSLARSLSDGELIMCQRVFAGTLPDSFLKSKVMVANGLGIGSRPYTSIEAGISTYKVYLGPGAFDSDTVITIDYKGSFIHEMTHVWQMHLQSWVGGVWFNSFMAQACHQKMAYWYGEGNLNKPWDYFNVEAQAQIVEDWFKNGMNSTDPRFHYIRDNIRMGRA